MLGFITRTSDAFSPRHRPERPSSAMTSLAVSMSPLRSSLEEVCCRVVTTATGMVNSWARAPATAPRESSAAVERVELGWSLER